MNTEQERAAFEAWYQLHHGSRDMYERDESGEYADKQVQGAFNVWHARAALASAPVAAQASGQAPAALVDLPSMLRDGPYLRDGKRTREIMEQAASEIERLRDMLCSLVDHLVADDIGDGNAPGHGHRRPGIWDSDNGSLAGKACAWCALWAEAKSIHAAMQRTTAREG